MSKNTPCYAYRIYLTAQYYCLPTLLVFSIESLFPNGIPGMAFGGFGGGLKRDSDDEYFDDENEDQPPMTPELATLLRQVPPSEHYYGMTFTDRYRIVILR